NGWIIVVMVLIAFSCVLYIGFDAVYDRLATLRDFRDSGSSRLQILKDIAVIFSRFPIFGTGLGTHSVVYPMFDHSTITTLVAHAENEYAQAAEEVGLIGLGSLIVFGIIICINYARNIRRSRTQNSLPVYSAVYGLGFGILAILINSLSDFGQHLPANSFLTAIFCALLLSIVGQNKKVAAKKVSTNLWMRKTFLIAAAAIWIWMTIGADNYRLAEKTWKQAQVIENNIIDNRWQGSQAEYEELISYAEKAASLQPDNIKYQYWLNVYRWRLLNQTAQIDADEPVVSPELLPAIRDIIDKFNKARMVCPTYGPAYSTVGQIQKFVLGDDSGAEQIKKGYLLAPCDPIACFVAGWLDVAGARGDECVEKFDRAIALDHRFFRDVANIYINDLSRPNLAILAAGENIGRLRNVANMLEEMQYDDLAEQVWSKMEILLEEQCAKPDVTANDVASLAGIYSKHGKTAKAIEYYNRALAMDYSRVYWRFDLARQLAKTKQIRQAIRELRICLRLRPQMKAAENLLVELSVDPNGFNSEETNLP
ncbi:MAG: O-antigen ligase family protein, partial [Planctomycetes bacterium]|nr:O-antigen ligase family protein [Planctomycetota bacterium]